jgi:serine/threonine protein kinase
LKVWLFLLDALSYDAQIVAGHRLAHNSGVLHRDISSGNVLLADELHFDGFLHDLDYSEVVLMPEDDADNNSEQQIMRRLKDMTVSNVCIVSPGF